MSIRQNIRQFSLLVLVNAFVGAMVGMERSILPELASTVYGLAAATGILSFIVCFGSAKAITNYIAGRLSDKVGRKRVLVVGWLIALPVPLILMWAPTWGWILAANVLLGISQGLTWSTTVVMKIDLAGPQRRGLAMGLNEFAGYVAVGLAAFAAGMMAQKYNVTPAPFYLGLVYAVIGLLLSVTLVRETRHHVVREAESQRASTKAHTGREIFLHTSFRDRNLSAAVQAGFVNNLNDGMVWGLFPILYAMYGVDVATIGGLAAIYPLTWGIMQLIAGGASDRIGRKGLIVAGMLTQALALAITANATTTAGFVPGALVLGLGTAMVYPTLLAAISDGSHPEWRASAVGTYRFWRDAGYPAGALLSAVIADTISIQAAVWSVASLTAVSGLVVLGRMSER